MDATTNNFLSRRELLVAGAATGLLLHVPSVRAEVSRPGLAVLYFDYTGQNPQLQVLKKGLAQMLISHLQPHATAYDVVERDRLEDILKELELAESGKVDASTAAEVGKLLGAKYLLMGSFFDLMGMLNVDARLVEVETGKILGAAGQNGPDTDFFAIEGALVDDLAVVLAQVSASSDFYGVKKPSSASPPKPKPAPKPSPKPAPRPKVPTSAMVTVSRSLDAGDRGDHATAKAEMKQAVESVPALALMVDLDAYAQ